MDTGFWSRFRKKQRKPYRRFSFRKFFKRQHKSAVMTTVVHDTFTDDDGKAIEQHFPDTYPGPSKWIRFGASGDSEIVNNRIEPPKTEETGWVIRSGVSDCIITAKLHCSGVDGPDMGIVFRMPTAAFDEGISNHFLLQPRSDDFLFKMVTDELGGGFSETNDALGSNASITRSIRIILNGESIQCYVDNTLLFTKNESIHINNTYHGYHQFGSHSVYGVWLDDFQVDSEPGAGWTEIMPNQQAGWIEILS
jgi:hypothetical protein